MIYIHRSLERKFMKMCDAFKVIMVTGARQVGKTTMLRHLAEDTGRTFVTMDDADIRELAERDPKLFFQMYRPPILIDEAQKAPQLFEQIKIICDQSDERGRFWLTGSQSRKLMKQAGDSLAGRIGILKMYSLSDKEIAGKADDIDYDWSFGSLMQRSLDYPENNILDVYTRIWEGGMPDTLSMDAELRREYWNSYIETYLMRDAVDENVGHGEIALVSHVLFKLKRATLQKNSKPYKTLFFCRAALHPTILFLEIHCIHNEILNLFTHNVATFRKSLRGDAQVMAVQVKNPDGGRSTGHAWQGYDTDGTRVRLGN